MAVHKKYALGRGLDALISTDTEIKTSGSSSINLSQSESAAS